MEQKENDDLKKMVLTFAEKLVQDLEIIHKKYPDFKIQILDSSVGPKEMIDHITNLTPMGKKFITD